jgi:glycosyltransferase involved in cell wall biosynthesis
MPALVLDTMSAPAMTVLSIVVPMLNEEALARLAISTIADAGERLIADGTVDDFEIVVVDDGSTDSTAAIIAELAQDNRHLQVVSRAVNGGLGAALRSGFSHARGSLVLYMDADLPFDLDEIATARRLIDSEGVGVVSAYRRDRRAEGWRRTAYSWVYNLLVRLVFDLRVRDANFAFKLCRAEVLDGLSLRSEGVFIDVELLVQARRRGYEIAQFEVDFFPRTRGVSTLSSGRVIAKTLRELLRFRIRRHEPTISGRGRLADRTEAPPSAGVADV